MSEIKAIAVEVPFLISYLPVEPVSACVYFNDDLFIYNSMGEMIKIGEYKPEIGTLEHVIKEGRYEWTDFAFMPGQIIARDYDYNILLDNKVIEPFQKLPTDKREISNLTLKLFNDFLKKSNSDNLDMIKALEISFNDGFFRQEVDEIVKNDVIRELSNLDKEIIVRCKIEGESYIVSYVKRLLSSDNYDKYIDINYFFRRLFNLEKYSYLVF